ncbi:MAG: ATP-binding cassette domain-containing protein [Bdellovibrionales bacterium]|nr:ATP-binding cassette domain-containing protein [Bdellovibrionales bacterium]
MGLIEVNKLSKHFRTFKRREGVWGSFKDLFLRDYRTLKAVDEISFTVGEGELLGYIGPNGAGKSTSIKMLTGILKPTSGDLTVMGYHPFRDRRKYTANIGVVFGQRTQLWWDIAVIESLKLIGKIYRVSQKEFKQRLDNLTHILALEELLHTPVRKLSLGQRIRCDLAASLIYGPSVLFLDEPTIGLDAVAKDSVRTFLKKINRDFRTTIIMTTHDLKEIEELCQRIMIIDKGHIIFDGALDRIRRLPGLTRNILIDFGSDTELQQLERRFDGSIKFEQQSARRFVGNFDPQTIATVDLIKQVVENYEVADFTVTEPEIEQIVMKIYREGASNL